MIFSDLLLELDKLCLPLGQYVITGSGPLAIRNLREAHDLDILVSDNLFVQLSKSYSVINAEVCDKISLGNIELLANFKESNVSKIANTDEQIKTADIIDGYPFVNLKILLAFKKASVRDKDSLDVELIEQFLKKNLSL